jgi:serine phosphatase RsbU (regulator of sigma subunit)
MGLVASSTTTENEHPLPMPSEASMVVGVFDGPLATVYVSEQTSKLLTAAREALFRQVAGVLIAGSIAAMVVHLAIKQVVSKPLRRIVGALRTIGSGNLKTRIDAHSCRELAYLGQQINEMTATLDAVEQDRRIHMEKAKAIQQNLRPRPKNYKAMEVAELFEPADDVGGDYYDVIELNDDQTLLCLADVSGHGVPAAMAATLLKSFVSEAAKQTSCPAKILNGVNQQFCEYIMMSHFATIVLIRIDRADNQLVYANAGHEWPFVGRCDGRVQRLCEGDLVLGVDEETVYQAHEADMVTGDSLVIVSDGVTEAFTASEEAFGSDRVAAVLQKHQTVNATDLVKEYSMAIENFRAGQPASDDTTLLVVKLV